MFKESRGYSGLIARNAIVEAAKTIKDSEQRIVRIQYSIMRSKPFINGSLAQPLFDMYGSSDQDFKREI